MDQAHTHTDGCSIIVRRPLFLMQTSVNTQLTDAATNYKPKHRHRERGGHENVENYIESETERMDVGKEKKRKKKQQKRYRNICMQVAKRKSKVQ